MSRLVLELKTINLPQEIRRIERRVSVIKTVGVLGAILVASGVHSILGTHTPAVFGYLPLGTGQLRMLFVGAGFLTPICAATLVTEFLWHMKTSDQWLAELAKFNPICEEVAFLRLTLKLQRNGYLTVRDLQKWARVENYAARRHIGLSSEPGAVDLSPGAAALINRAVAIAQVRNANDTASHSSP